MLDICLPSAFHCYLPNTLPVRSSKKKKINGCYLIHFSLPVFNQNYFKSAVNKMLQKVAFRNLTATALWEIAVAASHRPCSRRQQKPSVVRCDQVCCLSPTFQYFRLTLELAIVCGQQHIWWRLFTLTTLYIKQLRCQRWVSVLLLGYFVVAKTYIWSLEVTNSYMLRFYF